MSSVLYDVPGPRAVVRNRILGVITVLIVLVLLGFVLWRFWVTGQFSAQKWYAFTFTRIWEQFGLATLRTLAAFIVAAIGAIILGFVLAIGRLSDHAWVRMPIVGVIEVFRAIPVLIFMILLYYGLPVIGIKMPSYWAVVIALVVYNGSVLAEVVRAGVESLPRGQREAGYAIGLRKGGVMRLILLPQAIRAMMPVIISQLVVTLKDTALGLHHHVPRAAVLRPHTRVERRARISSHPGGARRRRHLRRPLPGAVVCRVRRGASPSAVAEARCRPGRADDRHRGPGSAAGRIPHRERRRRRLLIPGGRRHPASVDSTLVSDEPLNTPVRSRPRRWMPPCRRPSTPLRRRTTLPR